MVPNLVQLSWKHSMQCCFATFRNWLSQNCVSILGIHVGSLVSYQPFQNSIRSFNKSCSTVCMLQTLLKFPSPNHLLSMSNNDHKIESAIISSTSNLKSGITVHHVGIPHSPNFTKQLVWVPKHKLEYMLWTRAYQKMTPVWLRFGHQFWVLLMIINSLRLIDWHQIIYKYISLMAMHLKHEM